MPSIASIPRGSKSASDRGHERRQGEDRPRVITDKTSHRIAAALAIAIIAGVLSYLWLQPLEPHVQGADFTYPWVAARALLGGQDPYAVVGPANVPFGGAFYYPLTAALIALPFAWFPAWVGGVTIVAVGFGLLAFTLTRRAWWPLGMLLSSPAWAVCHSLQWTPLFVAAALGVPILGLVAAVKPNIAIAMFAYQTTRKPVIVGLLTIGALGVISLAISPAWPVHWLATMHRSPGAGQYGAPILTPLGVVIALATIRWRRPEARLLVCLAMVPQTGFLYDQLPLLLIPESWKQMATAVLLSWIVYFTPSVVHFDRTNIVTLSTAYIPLIIVGLYYPALAMVLRRRNVAR